MPVIIGVVFKKNDNVHYYDPNGVEVEIRDKVICHYADAIEIGEVVASPTNISEEELTAPLNKLVRKATPYDITIEEINRKKEKEGHTRFTELASKYKLDIKLVDVHVMFDKSKMIFYFTSDKRVDFREMVKDLASHFKIRIELRQIGVRDEAKIVGGLGPCGLNLCCKSFLSDFESISIKMAKDQNLPLNPLKISGICGRLMCCLKYEYETYRDFMKKAPEKGTRVECSIGQGFIFGYEPLKNAAIVEFNNENRVSVPLEEIKIIPGGKKIEYSDTDDRISED